MAPVWSSRVKNRNMKSVNARKKHLQEENLNTNSCNEVFSKTNAIPNFEWGPNVLLINKGNVK